ncbi:MAG TPA: hypothetical protein VFJ97_13045 [Dermatophilaceae bacterium]|nr:hypothetical protein [Dermatophilaceae bacterium]
MQITGSRSVRLLSVVLSVGALVAAATNGPGLLQAAQDVVDVQPQWLNVTPSVRGPVRLNAHVTVLLYSSGLQVRRDGRVVFETVRTGSILSVGAGRVDGEGADRVERVDWTQDSWHVTRLQLKGTTATYSGTLVGDRRGIPAWVSVTPSGSGVNITAASPGAELLVLHVERPQAALGIWPSLPARSLASRAWWVPRAAKGAAALPVMLSAVRGTRTITRVRADADVLLDLRHQGRGEIHAWAPALRLEIR